jgi:hypothetical protein
MDSARDQARRAKELLRESKLQEKLAQVPEP